MAAKKHVWTLTGTNTWRCEACGCTKVRNRHPYRHGWIVECCLPTAAGDVWSTGAPPACRGVRIDAAHAS